MVGKSGVGKTHLLEGIGRRACVLGYRVRYTLSEEMLAELGCLAGRWHDPAMRPRLSPAGAVNHRWLRFRSDRAGANTSGPEPAVQGHRPAEHEAFDRADYQCRVRRLEPVPERRANGDGVAGPALRPGDHPADRRQVVSRPPGTAAAAARPEKAGPSSSTAKRNGDCDDAWNRLRLPFVLRSLFRRPAVTALSSRFDGGSQSPCPCPLCRSSDPRAFAADLSTHRYCCFSCRRQGNQLELWAAFRSLRFYDASKICAISLGSKSPAFTAGNPGPTTAALPPPPHFPHCTIPVPSSNLRPGRFSWPKWLNS